MRSIVCCHVGLPTIFAMVDAMIVLVDDVVVVALCMMIGVGCGCGYDDVESSASNSSRIDNLQ